ncbi:hypothetical protein E1344_22580 [Salmonella enterica subsp. enterica serovar Bareilly]|nr:hypothetical protein [Salmonella enterica subsp. enterica serovar Bareilly]
MKISALVLIFSFFLLISSEVLATPIPDDDHHGGCTTTVSPINLTGSIHFQRDDPVGTESEFLSSTALQVLTCGVFRDGAQHDIWYRFALASGEVSGYSGVYSTELNGVGIRYYISMEYTGFSNCSIEGAGYISGSNNYQGVKCHYIPGAEPEKLNIRIKAKLVKTGNPIDVGNLAVSHSINTRVQFNGESKVYDQSPINVGSTAVVYSNKCSVISDNLVFDIGDVNLSDFSGGTGSSPGKNALQNLTLDCDAGTNINITLNGQQSPDSGRDDILALTNQGQSGVADGVGVQLLYNNRPLEINTILSLMQSEGGKENFQITARYIQTKDKVKAGTANATATLDLTYQ